MFKKLTPFDTAIRINYQHLSYDIFNLWMHFMWKDDRFFLYSFQQVDDV